MSKMHGVDEQLSAFLDGELPESEEKLLLRQLDRDAAFRERLSRFASIGQVLRGYAPVPDAGSLSQRISAAIADESEHQLAATSGWPGMATAGIAAAAGILVLSGLLSLSTVNLAGPTTAGNPADAGFQTVEFRPGNAAALAPERLTGYLVAHGDYSGGLSRQVMSSHVVNRSPDFKVVTISGDAFNE